MDTNIANIQDRTFHKSISVVPRAMTDDKGVEFFLFEISNEEADQHRTIFRMDGANIQEFNEEPIVTYGHPWFDSTDPDVIIGTGPAYIQDGKMYARYYPEQSDENPKAKKVVAKLREGIIKSASIVAEVIDYSRGNPEKGEDSNLLYFRIWKLLMWGIVMKGSNPKAKLRTQARAMEFYNSAAPQDQPTPQDTSKLEAEVLLTEQRLRLINISSSVAP